jgi:hypothetical protein
MIKRCYSLKDTMVITTDQLESSINIITSLQTLSFISPPPNFGCVGKLKFRVLPPPESSKTLRVHGQPSFRSSVSSGCYPSSIHQE